LVFSEVVVPASGWKPVATLARSQIQAG